jgi:lipopolysaccharide transport system ATP-binding protein
MLKLVTGILEPTSGQVRVGGRTYAMLELGAGFHPELSGRDNIFLNGSIYGFGRKAMRRKFEEIVAFAELERFIDTPVKHYSSGMFMRLGFAIAMHMDPEILVIDEVLAVGDANFQEKCQAALAELKRNGTTLLFVSHNAAQMRAFCDRAMLLQAGRLIDIGAADDVIDHYERLLHGEERPVSLLRVRPLDAQGLACEAWVSGADAGVEVLMQQRGAPREPLYLALDLFEAGGAHLFGTSGELPAAGPGESLAETRRARLQLSELPLGEGSYTVAVALQRDGEAGLETLDRRETELRVLPRGAEPRRGLLALEHDWDWEGASAPNLDITSTRQR